MGKHKRKRAGRPPKPRNEARICYAAVRVTAPELKYLKATAKRQGLSVSALLMQPFREGSK